MAVILALTRLRQGDPEFKATLGHILSSMLQEALSTKITEPTDTTATSPKKKQK